MKYFKCNHCILHIAFVLIQSFKIIYKDIEKYNCN